MRGNENAFPQPDFIGPSGAIMSGPPGLTKRELFAAMAMQGLIASFIQGEEWSVERYAAWCVRRADDLIAELEKTDGR